jgi:hypothetical protein
MAVCVCVSGWVGVHGGMQGGRQPVIGSACKLRVWVMLSTAVVSTDGCDVVCQEAGWCDQLQIVSVR